MKTMTSYDNTYIIRLIAANVQKSKRTFEPGRTLKTDLLRLLSRWLLRGLRRRRGIREVFHAWRS